jgi:hypothetical protein
MSVIGRLDDQVEAVLINPLKRERPRVEEAPEAPPLPPAPSSEERDAESSDGTDEVRPALPVWLL